MNIVSSYAVQIVKANKIFNPTIEVYRKALSFLIKAYEAEWDILSLIDKTHDCHN